MELKLVFAAVFLFVIASAMLSDTSRLIIPNWASATLVVAFLPYALLVKPDIPVLLHLLVALVLLAIGVTLFVLKWFGAGDVKLLAAVGLWAGPQKVLPLLLYMGLTGGVIAGVTLCYWFYLGRYHEKTSQRFPLKQLAHWGETGNCPYGLAIGVGALATIPAMFF